MAAGFEFGTYRILAPLDAGGMGEVYRALDTRLHREVAVKVLPVALSDDPDRVARLEREARLLAALNHPHIATIHGLEMAGGVRSHRDGADRGPTLADRLASADRCRSTWHSRSRARSPTRWRPRTRKGSSTAISSRRTSSSPPPATVKVLDFGLAKSHRGRSVAVPGRCTGGALPRQLKAGGRERRGT